jgi:hypothetical protein
VARRSLVGPRDAARQAARHMTARWAIRLPIVDNVPPLANHAGTRRIEPAIECHAR